MGHALMNADFRMQNAESEIRMLPPGSMGI